MLIYVFTKLGDVYSGWDFSDHVNYPDYKIIIQGIKKREYRELKSEERTFEKIAEYGWIVKSDMIAGILEQGQVPSPEFPGQGDSWSNGYERKIMFIFGAGASAYCIHDQDNSFYKDDLRPPLGPGLFEERFKNFYKKYKGVKQSLHFLQENANPNVEELFENEWKNINLDSNESVLYRHINILYYLQEVLKEASERVIDEYYVKNLYVKLADKLQKKYVKNVKIHYGQRHAKNYAFVSFNQDNILEHFLSEYFKIPIMSIDDYVNINENPFCVFKPHGSYNWGWKFSDTSQFNGDTPSWLFDNNKNFHQIYFELLGNHIDMIDWNSSYGMEKTINKHDLGKFTIDKSKMQIINTNNLGDYFPALLLPYRDKDEFTMPLRHFHNMQNYFQYVETLIIIGWKGNEEAFNRQLLKHAKRIKKIVIADPDSATVIKNLTPLLSKFNIEPVVYDNFEHFVNEGLDKELESQD
ncbi:MAG: hypothetical protein OQK06_06205 [Flavobacteriales bacterium]|nr:hypothetical protein [Flavobacteriales bacterium]